METARGETLLQETLGCETATSCCETSPSETLLVEVSWGEMSQTDVAGGDVACRHCTMICCAMKQQHYGRKYCGGDSAGEDGVWGDIASRP